MEDDDASLKLIHTTILHLETACEGLFQLPLLTQTNFDNIPPSYDQNFANTSESDEFFLQNDDNTSRTDAGVKSVVHKMNYQDKHENQSSNYLSPMHRCPRCKEGFNRESELKTHNCNVLTKFSRKNRRLEHSNRRLERFARHKIKPVVCFGRSRVGKTGLKNYYTCKQCNESFTSSTKLILHASKSHCTAQPFTCVLCNQNFAAAHELETHDNEVHRPHGETIDRSEAIDTHTNLFMCVLCNRTFAAANELEKHHDVVHQHDGGSDRIFSELKASSLRTKQFICTPCDRTFTRTDEFERHRDEVHRRYRCTMCSGSFAHAGDLNVHINQSHRELQSFVCMICDESLVSASDLERHISEVHELSYIAL